MNAVKRIEAALRQHVGDEPPPTQLDLRVGQSALAQVRSELGLSGFDLDMVVNGTRMHLRLWLDNGATVDVELIEVLSEASEPAAPSERAGRVSTAGGRRGERWESPSIPPGSRRSSEEPEHGPRR